MQYLIMLFFVLGCLVFVHPAFAQSSSEQVTEEQETYFLNDLETLNQIRQLQQDLNRLEAELERAQEILDRYTLEKNIPKELLEDTKPAQ